MAEITDIVTRGGASTCGTEIVYRIGITNTEIQLRELDPTTQRFVTQAEFAPDAENIPAEYLPGIQSCGEITEISAWYHNKGLVS